MGASEVHVTEVRIKPPPPPPPDEPVAVQVLSETSTKGKKNEKPKTDKAKLADEKHRKAMERKSRLTEYIKKHDTDGDGNFTTQEVIDMLVKYEPEPDPIEYKPDDPIDQMLKEFDTDGNGEFDYEEVRGILAVLLEKQGAIAMLKKFIGVILLAILGLLGALMGITLAANEASKENKVADGGLQVSLTGDALQQDLADSMAAIWDLPLVDLNDLAKTETIELYIDWRNRPGVNAYARSTFFISGAFSTSSTTCSLTTPQGYVIFIDNAAQSGTITMNGAVGLDAWPILESLPSEEVATRLRELNEMEDAGKPTRPTFYSRKDWAIAEDEFSITTHGHRLHEELTSRRRLGRLGRGRMRMMLATFKAAGVGVAMPTVAATTHPSPNTPPRPPPPNSPPIPPPSPKPLPPPPPSPPPAPPAPPSAPPGPPPPPSAPPPPSTPPGAGRRLDGEKSEGETPLQTFSRDED